MKLLLSVVLSVLGFAAVCQTQPQKVHITILYESLCPDSRAFIENQFLPNYSGLRDFIDVLFVPFGKSSSYNNGESFRCQHGPGECEGNMVQSCALNELKGDMDAQAAFVGCQMNYHSEPSGKKCSEMAGVSFENILVCMYTGTGTELQLHAEHATKHFSPRFVPTIVYNNIFSQSLQNRSLRDFKGVVCEQIGHVAPACTQ